MSRRIWFTSDIHLYYGGQAYLEQFLRFLDQAGQSANELYIVGDLFEFWIGDRQANFNFYAPLFRRLTELNHSQVAVKVIHGNRDFLMGDRFVASGCELLPEEIELNLAGQKIHVSHGDQFCIHDHSYQRARRIMRSAGIRRLATFLPAGFGVFLAKAYRRISERKKRRKCEVGSGNRFHTIHDGVIAEFRKNRHDIILCGHIHFAQDQNFEVDGQKKRVLTTGAWEEAPNYFEFDGESFHLRFFT